VQIFDLTLTALAFLDPLFAVLLFCLSSLPTNQSLLGFSAQFFPFHTLPNGPFWTGMVMNGFFMGSFTDSLLVVSPLPKLFSWTGRDLHPGAEKYSSVIFPRMAFPGSPPCFPPHNHIFLVRGALTPFRLNPQLCLSLFFFSVFPPLRGPYVFPWIRGFFFYSEVRFPSPRAFPFFAALPGYLCSPPLLSCPHFSAKPPTTVVFNYFSSLPPICTFPVSPSRPVHCLLCM